MITFNQFKTKLLENSSLLDQNINLFSINPVITEMKQISLLPGKLEYMLNDGSVVAINEDTQNLLNILLEDKYQVIEYMRESKENFMQIIREVI